MQAQRGSGLHIVQDADPFEFDRYCIMRSPDPVSVLRMGKMVHGT